MTPNSRYFLSFANYLILFTIFASSTKISYIDHCGSVVNQYTPINTFLRDSKFLEISNGQFSGGGKLLASDLNGDYFGFQTDYIRKTTSQETFQVVGYLSFIGSAMRVNNSYSGGRYRSVVQSISSIKKNVRFDLSGFWSESLEMICMVGTGSTDTYEGKYLHLSVIFKLYYPQIANISTSFVNGTVESLDSVDSPNYFEKITVSAYAQKKYSYMEFPPSIIESCSKMNVPEETRSFEMDFLGSYIPNLVAFGLRLEHGSDCNGGNCYPFSLKNGLMPTSLGLRQIYFSEEGKFHTRIGVFNRTVRRSRYQFEVENSLVGEGFWDHEKNQMCIVACQILANSSVGDCSIGISLWFPIVFTIKSRSHVMGRLWSNKNKNDSGYFSALSIRDFDNFGTLTPGMKYKFSLLDGARECDSIKKIEDLESRSYPDGSSKEDLSFSFSASKGGNISSMGYAYPLSIGETVFTDSFYEKTMEGVNVTVWNVSYAISYRFYNNFSSPRRNSIEIFAEGKYSSGKGHLCMVGCMFNRSSVLDNQAKIEDSMDCNVIINVQFPPMDPKEGEHLEGTIKSTRQRSDPLYFEPLSFSTSKMYTEQASESIQRMDVEIIMVIISLTLLCVFIRSQIIYAKKHKEVLPAISITMLVVLTLGCLIPLILNFEALLAMIQNKQNSILWNGEWMVVKEVVVRVLTLVAFVLHLLLLQVAWSARCASEGKKDFLVAEKKTMKLCLVLYFALALIAWFVRSKSRSHWWKWEDLFSYAGFILDCFLFPQIMFNVFRRSQEKALSFTFYVGMTIIRIFPHFYDIYRAHRAMPDFESFNIYASREVDFYSLSWNIIIPVAGIFFATLIFMQQRVSGDSIIPSRFRKLDGYVTMAELSL